MILPQNWRSVFAFYSTYIIPALVSLCSDISSLLWFIFTCARPCSALLYLCSDMSSLFCSVIPVIGNVVLVLLFTCARKCLPCSALLYLCSDMSSLLCSVIPVLGHVVLAVVWSAGSWEPVAAGQHPHQHTEQVRQPSQPSLANPSL